ncbi:DUF3151 domain-containing protein [Kutzneria albida]|uniref:DUF3151 domain-containing protein n=1 Tax=Kutzneria albida DSM 43870 TaxID=1449976 RepID=W5WME9_9PSEU|nr:DUF3151 domain-containing protein [Kutzneria albida]AHI01956.1 hypothetical protein KALB_8599 [Kutzneria albida DSM 43870]
MSLNENLLGPGPTLLPDRPQLQEAAEGGTNPGDLVRIAPDFSEAWALLAERALNSGDPIAAYAYARTGYHRGLDQLRRSGWKGFGPVPWKHRANQGFLRALAALAKAAGEIGETEEYERCRGFLAESDPEAPVATGLA